MKHVHHDLIVQWANDPSIQIQWRWLGWGNAQWQDSPPDWDESKEFRIKPHKHQELMDAYRAGKQIQLKSLLDGTWMDAHNEPAWLEGYEYRIKPEDIVVTHHTILEEKYGREYAVLHDYIVTNQNNVQFTFDAITHQLKDVKLIAP